jgi:hypothetical protein
MLILILDPHFKNLELIRDYGALELAMQVAINYDQKTLMPLLLIVYHASTPNSRTITSFTTTMVELSVFGSLVFIEKIIMGLIKTELSFFKRIVAPINPLSPFV